MSSVLVADSEDVAALLEPGQVHSVYQPIVDLDNGVVVAFEALARGPVGHPLAARPDLMFEAARTAGCVGQLDETCRSAALRGARAARLASPWTLFVNVEPAGIEWALSQSSDRSPESFVVDDLPVMVEITERDLVRNPTALLRFVDHVRSVGCGIALDDVGAVRESLALLPLLRPDVIKLDLRLVQQRPTSDIAQIFSAVNAEAERTGATVLAEGIETEAHLDFARGLGARLGQGYLLGRPGDLPETPPPPATPVPMRPRVPLRHTDSPFELASAQTRPRSSAKPLLVEISKQLEREALRHGESVVILATLQHARFFTASTAKRYRQLAHGVAFAALLGEGIAPSPLPGLRGGDLAPADPLLGEWDVAVLGPHFAAALVARDLATPERTADGASTTCSPTIATSSSPSPPRSCRGSRQPGSRRS